jgi:hypothetical protein
MDEWEQPFHHYSCRCTECSLDHPDAVVTFSDATQWQRAEHTIKDIRGPGRWWGPLVFIAVDFEPPADFVDLYEVTVRTVKRVSTAALERDLEKKPFTNGDGRERSKMIQWSKLRLFESWVTRYEHVFYVDAGFRVFHDVRRVFAQLDAGKLLALDDAWPGPSVDKTFGCQLETRANPEALADLLQRFPNALASPYFLNCAFAFDTEIVTADTFADLLDVMHSYPIFRTNEMGCIFTWSVVSGSPWTPRRAYRSGTGRREKDERSGTTWASSTRGRSRDSHR